MHAFIRVCVHVCWDEQCGARALVAELVNVRACTDMVTSCESALKGQRGACTLAQLSAQEKRSTFTLIVAGQLPSATY